MMKIDLKAKRGFTTVDLTIAMLVVLIFAVIMTSISYNIYLSSIEAKRAAVALNYAVDIFEHIGEIDYSEVTASYDIFEIASLNGIEYDEVVTNNGKETVKAKIGTYKIELNIEDYNDENVIKIVTLKIEYPVSRKNTEKLEMQRLKVIDNQNDYSL